MLYMKFGEREQLMLLAAGAVNSCFKDAADYLSEETVRGKANAMEP